MLFAKSKVKRRSERRWVALAVEIRMGRLRFDGVTINVSQHGIYLFAAANLPLGTEVEIVFRQPDSKRMVRVSGFVRRSAVYLYGIELLNRDVSSMGNPLIRAKSGGAAPSVQQR
jgi:hypothetical protein